MNIVISGLIGVGKSTLCGAIPSDLKLFEPVDEDGYLGKYYADPKAYALRLQLDLLLKRFHAAQLATWHSARGETVVQDRSIYEDFEFMRVQHEDGYINDRDFRLYRDWHNTMCAMIPLPDVVLYLTCPNVVNVALERMAKRNRSCEAGVPREYMEHLQKAYTELMPVLATKTRVIEINPDQSAEDVLKCAVEAIEARRAELEGNRLNPIYHGGI